MQTGRIKEENLVRRYRADSDPYEMDSPTEKEPLYAHHSALNDPADIFGTRRGGIRRFSTSSAASKSRKPLIDYARNFWRYDHRYAQPHEEPNLLMSTVSKLRRSRRVKRNAFISSIVLITSLFAFYTYIGPRWLENYRLTKSLSNRHRLDSEGLFGTNVRPIFSDTIHMKTLDKSLIPGTKKPLPGRPSNRRLIFVGDVHGCKDELTRLLDVVHFNQTRDHLILLGDLVTRGPDSLGVIDLAISLNATSVRGNHDDRVLLAHRELRSTIHTNPQNNDNSDHQDQNPPTTTTSSSSSPSEEDTANTSSLSEHRQLARSLTPAQHAYLSSTPLILFIPAFSRTHGHLLAVHGGLVPGVPLSHQDPFAVMNMRSIDLTTHSPLKIPASETALRSFRPPPNPFTLSNPDDPTLAARFDKTFLVPWPKLWNKYQQQLPDAHMQHVKHGGSGANIEGHATVLYGHDARRGLRLEKWTKGLDSGCARGGSLTAMIFEDGGRTSAVQVKCKDYVGKKKEKGKQSRGLEKNENGEESKDEK